MSEKKLKILVKPPPPGVDHQEFLQAFMQACYDDPEVQAHGKQTLTDLGCEWMDPQDLPEGSVAVPIAPGPTFGPEDIPAPVDEPLQ